MLLWVLVLLAVVLVTLVLVLASRLVARLVGWWQGWWEWCGPAVVLVVSRGYMGVRCRHPIMDTT